MDYRSCFSPVVSTQSELDNEAAQNSEKSPPWNNFQYFYGTFHPFDDAFATHFVFLFCF